jgi:hypothetical protein
MFLTDVNAHQELLLGVFGAKGSMRETANLSGA